VVGDDSPIASMVIELDWEVEIGEEVVSTARSEVIEGDELKLEGVVVERPALGDGETMLFTSARSVVCWDIVSLIDWLEGKRGRAELELNGLEKIADDELEEIEDNSASAS